MFANHSEETLDKVYDWITYTYYSPEPIWSERDNGPERRRERLYAIHALNDMRALYAGVGNNGWWDEERVQHLEDLQDYIPYSMEEVISQNEQIRTYNQQHEEAMESHEDGGENDWGESDEALYIETHAPEIVKMQGNKDGKLYNYTKELFWDSVEWSLNHHGWWQEKKALKEIMEKKTTPP